MKSQWLADVFGELDMTSDVLQIHISPDKPYFRLTTDGDAGTTQVDCPKESDVVESFTCSRTLVNKYRLSLLKPSEKASQKAKQEQRRTDTMRVWAGFLAFVVLLATRAPRGRAEVRRGKTTQPVRH